MRGAGALPGASGNQLPSSYRRLLGAWFCSLSGDGFRIVALPLMAAYLSSSSPGAVSLVATATVLPWLLFAIPAGAIVDRLPAIPVVLLAHLLRSMVTAALAVCVALDWVSIPGLCVVGFVLTAAETFADGAAQTALVQMVTPGQLEVANSRFVIVETIALDLVGPLTSGLTFGIARWLPFALSAALFLASASVLARLRVPRRSPVAAEPGAAVTSTGTDTDNGTDNDNVTDNGLWADIGSGLRRLFADPVLRVLVITVAVMAAATAAQDGVLVLFAQNELGMSNSLYPTLLAAYSLGTLAAGVVVGRLGSAARSGPLMVGAIVGVGSSMLVMGLLVDRWSAWICYAVMGLAGGTWNVLSAARRQRRTPHHMVARVSSAFRVVAWGFLPVGTALGGVLGSGSGVQAVFVISGAVVLVLGAAVARPLLRPDPAVVPGLPADTREPA